MHVARAARSLLVAGLLPALVSTAVAAPPGGLQPTPESVESLGLAINLPVGARALVERGGGKVLMTIQEVAETPAWTVRVQRATTVPGEPITADGHVELQLKRLRTIEADHRILRNEPVEYGGLSGHICYAEQTAADGQRYVTGWLVMPAGPVDTIPGDDPDVFFETRSFLLFSVLTRPEHYATVEPLLESSFRTMTIRSPATILATREARLEAGRERLERIGEMDLRTLVGTGGWYRIHDPGRPELDRPAREIGYLLVEIEEGLRGQLNPGRDAATYTPAEQAEGLLVRVFGRVVVDQANDAYFDSAGHYWMAWDGESEAWSVLTTARRGRASQSDSETGVRLPPSPGDPRPKLTVIRSSRQTYDRRPFEWEVPDIYLNHAMGWILGPLLPRSDDLEPTEMAWYTFSGAGARPTVTLRIDEWGPSDRGAGLFELRTRFGADEDPSVDLYDRKGRLVRRTRADGTITEPIEPDLLRRIWAARGLRVSRPR